MNTPTKSLLVLFVVGLMSLTGYGQSKIAVGDAQLPRSLTYNNTTMKFKGGAIREKLWFDIYSIGLYLSKNSNISADVVEADEPMGVRLEITSKLLSKEKLIAAFQRGFERSTEGDTSQYDIRIKQFLKYMNTVNVGDIYDLIYTPGIGTTIYYKGKKRSVIEGLDFKQRLMAIWLGPDPVDKKVKTELMGK